MKHSLKLLLIFIMFSSACTAEKKGNSAEQDTSKAIAENIDANAFEKGIKSADIQLLDVRTSDEYAQGHIKGAKMIDFYGDDFKEGLKSLDKEKAVYVYCRSGGRSGQAMKDMHAMGFKAVYNLKGGIMSWSASKKEIVR